MHFQWILFFTLSFIYLSFEVVRTYKRGWKYGYLKGIEDARNGHGGRGVGLAWKHRNEDRGK